MKSILKPLFTATVLATSLAACSQLGIKPINDYAPEYEQPVVEIPETFRYDLSAEEGAGIQAASLGWKDYFADPRLHRLIELTLQNNTDLRTAALNVQVARTQFGIQENAPLPDVGGSAGVNRSGRVGSAGSTFRVGLETGYELDLWGRIKNSNEAALQSYFATATAKDSVHLALIANVAKAHFQELHAEASMKMAEKTLASYQETYRLSKLRHKAGVISNVDLLAQESQIESAKASYANAVRSREMARNALEVLISQPLPKNLPKPLSLEKQYKVRNLPAGLSSQVMLNRPDIRKAEFDLKQANANIGIARANMYPTISLTGTLGLASPQLGNLFKRNSGSWGAGVGASNVSIFDWGTKKANVEVAKLQQEKVVLAYEKAVETAFQEVSDALVGRAALNSQLKSNQAQRAAQNERLRLINLRYKHGIADSLDLLEAQRSSYNADTGVLATQLNLLNNMADLYKVLGGGLKRHTSDEAEVLEQIETAKQSLTEFVKEKAQTVKEKIKLKDKDAQ